MLVPEENLYTPRNVCKEYGGYLRRAADDFQRKKLLELEQQRREKFTYQIATFSVVAIFVGGVVWRWFIT